MYGIAYRFFESFLFVAWSLSNVVLPRIARSDGGRGATQPFQMAMTIVQAVYIPIAVGSLFAAEWVVTTVFGDRYASAAPAVKWLTWALVLYGIAYLARTGTISLGRRSGIAQVAVVALVVNVVANLILIPNRGFNGAAAATFITEVVDALLLAVLFARSAGGFRLQGFLIVPVFAGGAMALVLWVADVSGGVVLLVGPLVYFAALALGALLFAPGETRRAVKSLRRTVPATGASTD
jgi:O-antigen/teichoic acid export membrane protein